MTSGDRFLAHFDSNDTNQDDELIRCRGCSSSELRVDWSAGDRVCTSCGLVDEEHLMEERPEWREFDDADDLARNAHGGAAARCGLMANDERAWIGGLQPTSLSKHCFGGGATSSLTRKKLARANDRIERLIHRKHAVDVENARLSIRIRERKRRRVKEDDDDEEEEEGDCDESVRPELEQMLVQEEETSLATSAALYADKWSLDRAIRMFGTGHEIETLQERGNDDRDVETLQNGLDKTLIAAAHDLYSAYSILLDCAKRLQLPERVVNEATGILVKYAARRDGLFVRGVSSHIKQVKSTPEKGSHVIAAESQAREALREFNKMKQFGSLVAAIVFYTARTLSVPRSILQVCSSVDAPSMVKTNPYLDASRGKNKKDSFVKKKHCSKAMNEIKQVFPDLTRNVIVSAAGGHELLMNDTSSTESVLDHLMRKLQLPPVAEASVRTLVLQQQQEQEDKSLETKKCFVMCAAVSYFVCHVGEIMQTLAQQASADCSTARPVIVAGKKKREVSSGTTSSAEFFGSKNKEEDKPLVDDFSEEEAREHRAYEMRRVWDAWRDQTPWRRTPAEIEHVAGVSVSLIESFFKTTLFPKRKQLLHLLTEKSKLVVSTAAGRKEGDSILLSHVPLASVLLPHVVVTEPLLKEGMSRRKVT